MGFLVILSHLVGHASLYFMSLYHINITEETLQHATFSLHNILVFCCLETAALVFLLPHLFSAPTLSMPQRGRIL